MPPPPRLPETTAVVPASLSAKFVLGQLLQNCPFGSQGPSGIVGAYAQLRRRHARCVRWTQRPRMGQENPMASIIRHRQLLGTVAAFAAVIGWVICSAPASAQIYEWRDSSNGRHFANSLEQVPPEARDQAEI